MDAYNGEASLAASGQIDLFTGDTKSKDAILTDILNNLGYDIRTFDTIGRAAESAEESTAESAEGQVGEGGQTGSPVQSDAAGGEQVSGTEVTPESNSESSVAELEARSQELQEQKGQEPLKARAKEREARDNQEEYL